MNITNPQSAVIKVFGVGGGGGNAISYMANSQIEGVDFYWVNTDAQALAGVPEAARIQIGLELTKGLGAGAKPEIGQEAALESREKIAAALENTDMVFVTAGMGGGTGTGAAPVVASIAREMGILTVGVVTTPFTFEGRKRMDLAVQGIDSLKHHVDSLITIPNERLLNVLGSKISLLEAFSQANGILYGAVQGISDLIVRPGMINVDFADVRTVMSEMGLSMMGSGVASGENRAEVATNAAIYSPLLNNVQLNQAKGILINVTAGADLGLGEFHQIGSMVEDLAGPDATVVVGTVIDENMDDEIRVTLVATGLDNGNEADQNPVYHPSYGASTGTARMASNAAPTRSHAIKNPTVLPGQNQPKPMRASQPQGFAPRPMAAAPQQAPQTTPQAQPQQFAQQPAPAAPQSHSFGKPEAKPAQQQEQSLAEMHTQEAPAPRKQPTADTSMLDIPAFLRRQTTN